MSFFLQKGGKALKLHSIGQKLPQVVPEARPSAVTDASIAAFLDLLLGSRVEFHPSP